MLAQAGRQTTSGRPAASPAARLGPSRSPWVFGYAPSARVRSRATVEAHGTKVKICGVTCAEDAEVAAAAGADFIGMIMWPKAKRAVSDAEAARISEVARWHGVQAVGVFVDEDAATIAARCSAAGIPIAQLHGDGARASLGELQGQGLEVIYVMHAESQGAIVTPPPAQPVEWILIDGLQGGSGQALEWGNLRPPRAAATSGWLLAGGLQPGNVAAAIDAAAPGGVDVSSGVCLPDGLRKDPAKVARFVTAARSAQQLATGA